MMALARRFHLPVPGYRPFVPPWTVVVLCLVGAVPAKPADEIYRCETEDGVVFTDLECAGEGQGERVTLAPDTAGITPGPPDEVREYLARKREERAEALRKEWEWAARQPAPTPAPVVIERRVGYPYGWGGYGYRPPRPPLRPEPPIAPPVRPPQRPGGGDVLRPLR
jgi:hypothetical protein